jgi:hypothetical protein
MKHVNEPLPDVLTKRPDLSAAIAAVIDRATTKDARDRYGSVGEMVRDLEATLEMEAARAGGVTGEATSVLESVPRSRRRMGSGRSRAGVAMALVGVALVGAALIFGGDRLELGGGDEGGGSEVRLGEDSATDFDPFGGDGEHPELTQLAVDNNPTTAWSTQDYQVGLEKPGVGIYVDAGTEVAASAVEVSLSAGGGDLEVRSAPGASSAPRSLNEWQLIGEQADAGTEVRIETPGAEPSRFYLIWFTKLPGAESGGGFTAEVSDIRLFS